MSDTNKMAEEIRAILKDLLSETEEKARLAKAEQIVQSAESTILELTNAVTSREDEVTSLTGDNEGLTKEVEELKSKIAELEGQLEESSKSFKEIEEEANKVKAELASLAKDRQLEVRTRELEEAKVLRRSDKLEAQKARVRDMDDEEFAAYKAELVEIRAELEKTLKEQAGGNPEGDPPEGDPEVVEVAPPDLDKAGKEAAAAALNVEVASEDIKSKWDAWGKALAENMRTPTE